VAVREVKVKVGERWFTVEVEEPIGATAKVTVEGQSYVVEVEGLAVRPVYRPAAPKPAQPIAAPKPHAAPKPPPSTDGGSITSPMSGKVLAVKVKPGATVSAGDEVCVVEAMKMEQSIRAPRDGKIKKIYVKPMQQVAIHAPLMDME
jgi:biotin carboxyl carrier protein